MTDSRVIRRSSAKNLPPSADTYTGSVVVMSDGSGIPKCGTNLIVRAPCGMDLRVCIREASPCESGWDGWADVDPAHDSSLRALGVPQCDQRSPMRVFSWQVLQIGNM